MIRPQITLKVATSLDGKIALKNGTSEWITGEKSRAQGRRLRAAHDAIAVGANTALIDNPQLTTRIDEKKDPLRVVFDSHLRLSPGSNLALTAKDNPVWVFCKNDQGERAETLKALGVTLLEIEHDGALNIIEAVRVLKRRHVNTLLVEGGGTLAASFIRLGFVDVIEWFRAPIILGGDGRSAIGSLDLENLDLANRYNRAAFRELGDDLYERYERIVE